METEEFFGATNKSLKTSCSMGVDLREVSCHVYIPKLY